MATKVITGVVRLSYANLLEPRVPANGEGDPKYSVCLLVPKTDTKTIAAIKAAQQEALENGKSSKFGGSIPKKFKDTFRDGDEEQDLEKNPEFEGCMFLNVSSKTKPGIVDENVQPVMDPGQVYSGVHARVSINAFPFNYQGTKGVSFGLNNVQVLGYGDPLAGGASAEDDFSEFSQNSSELL